MKTLKYICMAATLGLTVSSCYDLDLEPKGQIYENVLFQSEQGVQKYFALLYQDLPIEDFNYGQNGDQRGYGSSNNNGWHKGNQWQAQKSSPASAAFEATGRCCDYGGGWGYWPYDRIRDINTFIQNFPNYKENFTEGVYNNLLGEAHFLRAYYYFGMVKRYGGVPIITTVQDPTAPLEELQVTRDTEYDCWKFIHDDLQYAIDNCTTDAGEINRANRYTAAALMSRAMLYAASAAKYGDYPAITGPAVTAGLMDMLPEQAEEFWQYAYDASKIVDEGGYALHQGSDKVQAFIDVFMTDNEEDIMVKDYGPYTTTPTGTMLFHSWDTMVLPKGEGLSQDVGCALQPVWELISMYEMPAIVDENGNPVRFDEISDIWDNDEMEPRCKATFYFPGMTEDLSGTVFDIQGGVYSSYPGTAADGTAEVGQSINDYTNQYRTWGQQPSTVQTINGVENVKVNGAHGMGAGTGDEGYIYTGAVIRKYVNISGAVGDRGLHRSHQSWKAFRYAEILLNRAEAAYELGLLKGDDQLKQEAIDCINQIRDRAGAQPYTLVSNPVDVGTDLYGIPIDENLQFIRDERARELAFENQRVFDLRRWRVADQMFIDGKYTHALQPYLVLDENKYIFLAEVTKENRKVNFNKANYYEQIPGGEINKNPLLVRNDGY